MPAKIKKRGFNSYLLTVCNGYINGKQKTFTKTIKADNITEARKAYKLFEAECLAGKVVSSITPKITLSQFFAYWIDHYAKPNLAATTIKYNEFIAVRILAALGHLQMNKITAHHCLTFFEQLRQPDMSVNGKPLSASTIGKHYSLLKELMNYAVKWDFVTQNPLTKIDPPKKGSNKIELPPKEEIARFLKLLADETEQFKNNPQKKIRYIECLQHQLWTAFAFFQGLRTEEIFGLQRNDIDGDTLHVRRAVVYVPGEGVIVKDTKSRTSKRSLALSYLTKDLMAKYFAEISTVKVASTERWLFVQKTGKIAHPQSFGLFLRRFCKRHNLKGFAPHKLRHMYGSYLMASGLDLAATSHQLGHTNKSFTANTYIHIIDQIDTRAAEVMQNVIDGLMK